MKKLFILALSLVFALSIAMPALAYTTNVPGPSGSGRYTLDIYLVEYSGNDYLSGMISKAPVDRGYTRNEIVAAIAAIVVPANEDVYADGYRQLQFSGTNASLYVTENNINGTAATLQTSFPYDSAANRGIAPNAFIWDSGENTIRHNIGAASGNAGNEIAAPSSKATYRVLFFAKVTADNAKLSFRLSQNAQFADVATSWKSVGPFQTTGSVAGSDAKQYIELSDDLVVVRQADGNYIVFENKSFNNTALPGNPLFRIEVTSRGKTERLYMYTGAYDGPLYRIHVEPSSRELIFLVVQNVPGKVAGDPVRSSDREYSSLRYFYDTYFENKLGFTAFNEGNLLTDADFRAIANADDSLASVDIKPWTPYVSVPDNTITNPPKTGDASMLGFVFIGVAAIAALALGKARAQEKA